jgi:LemA protein
MKKIAIGCGVLVVLGFILLLIFLIGRGSYNRLVQLSQQTDSAWAQVQTDYQRRMDLIPNLVATVSGAANFEKSTLTQVTEARASVGRVNVNTKGAPGDPAQLAAFNQAQTQLSSALSRLLVVVERYPDLKSSANFLELQAQLEGTENRIAVARRDFNDAVQKYDTAIKSFPAVLYAGRFGFREKPYFNAAPGAETAPKVQFDFNKATPAPAPAKP